MNARLELADRYASNYHRAAAAGQFPADLHRSGGKPNINKLSDGAASAQAICPDHVSPVVIGHDGTVNEFLVTYLDSIDEQLLEYLDEDDDLRIDAVQRIRFYTSALLEGSISPKHVEKDWLDWFALVPAIVATYGSEELRNLEDKAEFLRVIGDVSLTEADLAYLKALEAWLDTYPEMRSTEEWPSFSAFWERPVDGGEKVGSEKCKYHQIDKVHGLPASLAKRAGVVHLLLLPARVGRPLNPADVPGAPLGRRDGP